MKRFKHLWMSVFAIVLAVSLMIGTQGLVAFATKGFNDGAEITTPVTLQSSVYLGEEFDVGTANVKVVGPDGKVVAPQKDAQNNATTKYLAKMPGNYIVTFTASDKDVITHVINCKAKNDFEFRVANGGAQVPTFISLDKTVDLPSAAMYFKDEKTSEYLPYLGNYEVKLFVDETVISTEKYEDGKVTSYLPENGRKAYTFTAGRHSVQYVATLANSDKTYVTQYEVKGQKDFVDKTSPVLSLSGLPSEASINTKVTLPKATATDDFDANVYVKIVVSTADGNEVFEVDVDDNGFATGYKKDEATGATTPVVFDNAYNLSFYPIEKGKYKISYTAYDDMGRTSTVVNQPLDVYDKTAPTLMSIADDQIPTKWGKTVKNTVINEGTGASEEVEIDKTILFPYPEYIDNVDAKKLTVSFEIRDTVNNNTVIKFKNIYDYNELGVAGDGTKYTYNASATSNGMYGQQDKATYEFTKEGFEFSFDKYLDNDALKDIVTTGRYTVIYQARDSRPNITTKSFDINLEDSVVATTKPTIEFAEEQPVQYVLVKDEYNEITFPTPKISDADDSRPTTVYSLIGDDGKSILEFDPSKEKLEIAKLTVKNVENIYIRIDDGDPIKVDSTSLKYKVSVVNDFKMANDNTSEMPKTELLINSDFKDANVPLSVTRDATGATANDEYVAGKKINIGKFVFNKGLDEKYNNYNGFEISLTDSKNNSIATSFETYRKKTVNGGVTTYETVVDKLTFTPANKDIYSLTVKAYDVTGRAVAKTYTLDVAAKTGGGGGGIIISSTKIQPTGDVNKAYTLNNETIDTEGDACDPNKAYIVRRISGARNFKLMGLEFTALSAGTYYFQDGYYKVDDNDATTDEFKNVQSYNFAATETSTLTFELLGRMPAFAEKNVKLTLPLAIAFNEVTNATNIDITVTNPNGVVLDKSAVKKDAEGHYYFTPTIDGKYTVVYKASINGSAKVDPTPYTITVGDVIAPTFTLGGTTVTAVSLKAKFQFLPMDYQQIGDNVEAKGDITFTKKLIDKTGATVYSVSGKGTYVVDGETKYYSEKLVETEGSKYVFASAGDYTVEYSATDKAGNTSYTREVINVTITGSSSNIALKALSTILIIVGVILIAGVILYFVRFRKHKETK